MLHEYEQFNPTRVLFGESMQKPFFDRLAALSNNWLVVTGGGSADRNGIYDLVSSACAARGISLTRYKGILPNPDIAQIDAAVSLGLENGCKGVLALGGGSVMDASKVIAIGLHTQNAGLWPTVTFAERHVLQPGALNIACIPTTAGTASEVTPYAVISNRALRDKRTFVHEAIYPTISWLNPAFTVSVPQHVTAETSADILSHVLENYVLGGNGGILADAYSEAVIRTVLQNLPLAWEDGADIVARGHLMMASNWALNGFQSLGRKPAPFILHAIEHVMSAWKPELAHGRGLATLFPAYFHWLLEHHRAETRLARLATVMFELPGSGFDAKRLVIELHRWLHRFGLGHSMEDLGFARADYPLMAEQVFRQFRRQEIDVLGPFTPADVVEIFELTRFQHQKS